MLRSKLTPAQERIFRYMAKHFATHQQMPTLREIGKAVGITNPNGVLGHLKLMAVKGYLRTDGFKTRSWEIVGLAEAIAPVVSEHVDAMLATFAPQIA